VTGWLYAQDVIRFRYAPSALALSNALKSLRQAKNQSLLIVGDPKPLPPDLSLQPLAYSDLEVDAVRNHFTDQTVFSETEATRKDVIDNLPGNGIVHFACHGIHDFEDPLNSGLVMAQGDVLSLRDILALRLPEGRLAVLSACSTGIVGASLPDEYVSLPGGMMLSGVDGVISSLWPVGDMSTMMLMTYFYESWRVKGHELPVAFNLAQEWVRDSTDGEKLQFLETRVPQHIERFKLLAANPSRRSFTNPNSWAAFTYTGI